MPRDERRCPVVQFARLADHLGESALRRDQAGVLAVHVAILAVAGGLFEFADQRIGCVQLHFLT